MYIKAWNSSDDITAMDRYITTMEIQAHLQRYQSDSYDAQEALHWIAENGQAFRSYLNTLKIATVAYYSMCSDQNELTWGQFCYIHAYINKLKEGLLDTILVENTKT